MKKKFGIVFAVCLVTLFFVPSIVGFTKANAVNDVEDQVNQIYESMDASERVCQTFLVHFKTWGPDEEHQTPVTELNDDLKTLFQTYHYGGVVLFGGNTPTTENTYNLTRQIQENCMTPLHKGTANGIPAIITTDQEGGTTTRLNTGTSSLGNMGVGAANDPQVAANAAKTFSRELKAVGLNSTLAPCIDVNSNAGNPIIGLRSFGDDPNAVAENGVAFMKQCNKEGVLAFLKHFPGHGDVDADSHTGLPINYKIMDELKATDLVPYYKCIPNGANMVMTAHIQFRNIVPEQLLCDSSSHLGESILAPATLSRTFINDVLRDELGFKGISATDAIDMGGIAQYFTPPTAVKYALDAGNDMIAEPVEQYTLEGYKAETDAIITAVNAWTAESAEHAARFDDAVKNVIRNKIKAGLINYNPDAYSVDEAIEILRNPEHLAMEYEDAAKGLTLVKNVDDTLPIKLDSSSRVLFLCQDPADKKEDGACAIAWNRLKKVGLVPDGATSSYFTFNGDPEAGHVTDFEEVKKQIDNADYVVVDSGINGNAMNGYLQWQTAFPRDYVDYAHQTGKKSIVLCIRLPYDCQLYENADAVFVTYNHFGTYIEDFKEILDKGITCTNDVSGPMTIEAVEAVFGNINPGGKLSVNIPKFNYDPEHPGYTDEIVYPRGHGLHYDKLGGQLVNINNVAINLEYTKVDADGTAKRPNVSISTDPNATVTYSSEGQNSLLVKGFSVTIAREDKTFKEGKDYTLSYSDNVAAGTASVTITGTGALVGSKTINYEVCPAPSETAKTGDVCWLIFVALSITLAASMLVLRKCRQRQL